MAVACVLAGVVTETSAQVNYSGGMYQQTFDSLPASGTSISWVDNLTLPGWYAWRTTPGSPPSTLTLDTGTSTSTSVLHNYGATGSTDRALGLLPGATPGNVMVGLRLHNNGTATYHSFTVTYDGEQWRSASASTHSMGFACTAGTPANLNDASVNWVGNGYLAFYSPVLNSNGVALDGNVATNRDAGITGTVGGITWAPGTDLWIRFTSVNQSPGNQGLALDNFNFSASTNVVDGYTNVLSNFYAEAIGSIHYTDDQLVAGGSSLSVRNLPQTAYIALALNYPDPSNAVTKAEAYLDLMFAKQDTNPASSTYGHFVWDYTDTSVTDLNSTEFCFKPLSVILKRYGARLGTNYLNSIRPMILNGLAASRARSVATNYSNIYTMRIVNWLLLGEALPDATSYNAGLNALAAWSTEVSGETIHEYDSDTYSMVTYCNLLIGANNATNTMAADKLRSLANFLATDLAVNYFNGQCRLGGSKSRDYDFVNGNGAVDHFYYLEQLQAKLPAFGSLSEGVYAYLNVVENGNRPPADVLTFGNSWTNRVVKSIWGGTNTPGQDRYNYLTPDFCIGSSGDFYGSTQDKAIAADFTATNPLAQVTLVYDPYDSPYGDVMTPDSSGHLKQNHLKFDAANVQDKGYILSLASLAASFPAAGNFLGPYTNISTAVVFPAQADAVYLDGAAVATSSGGSYAATNGSVAGIQEGNTVMAARFYRVDGLAGQTPTYAVKFDGGNAARFVAYQYAGAATSFNNATDRPVAGVILAARVCTNAAAVSNFLAEVKNAAVTLTTNGTQSGASATIGGTALASTMDTGSGTVIARKVNGANYVPQMYLLTDGAASNRDLFTERFARMLGSGWIWTPLSGVAVTTATYFTNATGTSSTLTSGEPLTATPDAGGLVYRTFTGDAEIVARVNQQSDTSPTSLAGVALRETLNAGASGVVAGFSGPTGVRLLWRATTSGPVSAITNAGFTGPGWLRLRRTGNVFSAAYRSDSGAWQPVGTDQTIVMNATAYGGLAAAGGTTIAPATTVFSNVVGNSVFSPTPAAPTGFSATANATNALALNWTDNATNETGFSLEASTNAGMAWNPVTTTAAGVTSFTNSGLLAGTAYYYRLAAINAAGLSAYAYTNASTWTWLQGWRQSYFGTISNSGSAADTADLDGDGLVNLLEYALGSNPLVANTNVVVAGRDAGGNLTFTFPRARADVTYVVQGSTNLQSWVDLNTNLGTVGQNVIFTDPVTNRARHFLRLKITQP
ncbi:MAG: fibronectin type III domain-containing protein [Verrucomicrobiae bacterium]|nr:fibronectin type III domain-containing protein [Verrucomicrobiae bacterium]